MAANGTMPAPPGLSEAEGPPTHEVVRDAVLRDIETKVAEKMEEIWRKGRQMLAQVHQKQQEKTEQLMAQIQQCKEQQEVLERENQTLKQVLTKMASHLSQLGLEKPGVGYSSPTTAGSVTTTPQRATQSEGTPADVSGEVSTSPPEVSAFPFASMAAPLSLAEALSSSLSSPVPPTPLSLAKTLAGEAASPAVPTAPWPPQVFSMTLRKADGAELGLNVKALDSQKVVLVEGIRADGAVEAWNRQCVSSAHPERAILAGDRIISVNGISYEPDKMLEECRDKHLLKLTLLRGDLGTELAAPLTLRADASEFVPKGEPVVCDR